jgi:hypothetical protein
MNRITAFIMTVMAVGLVLVTSNAQAQKKPNIVVIWGDDVGM